MRIVELGEARRAGCGVGVLAVGVGRGGGVLCVFQKFWQIRIEKSIKRRTVEFSELRQAEAGREFLLKTSAVAAS